MTTKKEGSNIETKEATPEKQISNEVEEKEGGTSYLCRKEKRKESSEDTRS